MSGSTVRSTLDTSVPQIGGRTRGPPPHRYRYTVTVLNTGTDAMHADLASALVGAQNTETGCGEPWHDHTSPDERHALTPPARRGHGRADYAEAAASGVGAVPPRWAGSQNGFSPGVGFSG